LAILALPLIVSGCGIPPVITIASYALDGAVLIGSGKTMRDHALSAAVGQDCSMFRVVSGNPICTDYEPSDAAAAALDAMPASEEMLAATSDGRVIRVAAAPAPAPSGHVVMVASMTATPLTARWTGLSIAANAPPALEEVPLMTTRDGRVIQVAALPDPGPATPVTADAPPTLIHLSWIVPSLVLPATQ
jgi:hypothetical protein